ncbi:MAG: hypothetical protein ACI4MQ_07865 [Candidatus Coproplasma sp.]
MITVAKCKNGPFVQLPENVNIKSGDSIPCPDSCNYKVGVCANPECFSVTSVYQVDEKKCVGAKRYSDAEVSSYWGQADLENSDKEEDNYPSKVSDSSDNVPVGETVDIQPTVQAQTEANTNRSSARPKTFGRSLRTQSGGTSDDSPAKVDDVLKPQGSYNSFMMSGKVYTDDASIKALMPTQPLRNALWEVFSYWETRSVFKDATQLKDEFIWLITTLSTRPFKRNEIDKILSNDEYGVSEKFFYMFYDVIYRYEKPKGFYWCDDVLSLYPLIALFRDKSDFMVKYCNPSSQGEQFRAFYMKHKREVLHFLGSEDEEKLFGDMTLALAKDRGDIVLIDKYNNFNPINMGTIDVFINNMQQPTDLANMNNMIYFLKRYRVTRLGVFPRTIEYPFEGPAGANGAKEDEIIYSTLGLGSSLSLSEYDCYVTLLQEYVRAFNPQKVTIGVLTFTQSNFSAELKEIVRSFCKAQFGQVSDEEMREIKGRAWLAKSIYDRNILSTFVLENKTYVDSIMQLIVNPVREKYFSLFDDAVIQMRYRDLSVHEYIEELLQDEVYTVCGRFREDAIVREYFDSRIRNNWKKADLSEYYDKYEEQFSAFLKQ